MRLFRNLPKGARMSPGSGRARHRINTTILALHIPVLVLVGLLGPRPDTEVLLVLIPLVCLLASRLMASPAGDRLTPGAYDVTSLGLLSCTYILIELSGGAQEAHFHIFVILVFVAMYQSWRPLLWAIVSVVVHHTVVGMLWPREVFGMEMHGLPLLWMIVYHVGMVVLEVVGILCIWHFAEVVEADMLALAASAAQAEAALAVSRQDEAQRQIDDERRRREEMAAVTSSMVVDAEQIRASVAETSRSMQSVHGQMENFTVSVHEIAQRAHQAADTATDGQKSAEEAADRVRRLEASVSEISAVNALIANLAAQTNLLALNATIEAARAGELGRGFAVVANEVKSLATETAASAGRVNAVIGSVVEEVGAVAAGFAFTTTVVREIQGIQTDIATSVEEQATTVQHVAGELANASVATRSILDSLDALTNTAANLS